MKLAVIPARGGSKRIPRKNIREFCGKPMIAWSMETATRSGLFDRIIVSTDDEEIASVNPDRNSQNDWQYLSLRAVAKKSVYLHADRVAL